LSQVVNILQTHYPERLGAALILNVPFLIQAFFSMIKPFIDPITRNKMKFNPKAVQDGLFAADELFKESGWGGSREFVWDHEKYWGSFVRMCAEIREGQMARWRKLGACAGCDEREYKLGEVVDVSLAPAEVEAKAEVEANADAEAGAEAEVEAGAEALVEADAGGDRVVAEDAAPETSEALEDTSVSQAQVPALDKVSGGGEMEDDRVQEGIAV
jgi:hypothetical protein